MKKSTLIMIIIIIILLAFLGGVVYFYINSNKTSSNQESSSTANVTYSSTSDLHINISTWNYDSTNDVYWQIGLVYCSKPATKEYESMGIYVPGKYFNGTKNSDGTYTCTINESEKVGNYTAKTAPIVMPINTGGYSAQAAPTSYSYNGISDYLSAGLIYVYSGCRGRSNGSDYVGNAPYGVTDLKSAVRYLRYNKSSLPGDTDSIFTFGHSGGGAQSALMGATGDSKLYTTYLESIGAIMNDDSGNYISDAVKGSMCWCPITSLDYADEAYEWNMGQYSTSGTRADSTWTSALSDDLATKFGEYVNNLKLKDNSGNVLTLDQTTSGIYTSGSYYNYILSEIETSLNNFLSDTTFPYTPSNSTQADGGFSGGGFGNGSRGGQGMTSSSSSTSSTSTSGTTYQTAKDYIASLNSDEEWITYDESTNTAKITSVEAFVKHCKTATKDVGAFDSLSRSQAENDLFGNSTTDALHFDKIMAQVLSDNASKYSSYSDYNSQYASDYASDITNTDSLGNDSQYRQNMYNPMYYLSSYYDGYGSSNVAKYWRIRTGINQGDTALTTETNLALALQNSGKVSNVDFATVWGLGHTPAERTGSSTTNFIDWVYQCMTSVN